MILIYQIFAVAVVMYIFMSCHVCTAGYEWLETFDNSDVIV